MKNSNSIQEVQVQEVQEVQVQKVQVQKVQEVKTKNKKILDNLSQSEIILFEKVQSKIKNKEFGKISNEDIQKVISKEDYRIKLNEKVIIERSSNKVNLYIGENIISSQITKLEKLLKNYNNTNSYKKEKVVLEESKVNELLDLI